jgi:threonylcarbamoyladenosine tRNA methylthiotransferase MtaB
MLHILSDKKRRNFYEQNLGAETNVLFENDIENGIMHGFTDNYVRVSAKYDPVLVNEVMKVKLVGIDEKGLVSVEEVGVLSH